MLPFWIHSWNVTHRKELKFDISVTKAVYMHKFVLCSLFSLQCKVFDIDNHHTGTGKWCHFNPDHPQSVTLSGISFKTLKEGNCCCCNVSLLLIYISPNRKVSVLDGKMATFPIFLAHNPRNCFKKLQKALNFGSFEEELMW